MSFPSLLPNFVFLCMLNITIAVNHSAMTTSAGNTIFPQFFAIGNEPIDFVVQDIAVIMVVAAIMLAITFKLKGSLWS